MESFYKNPKNIGMSVSENYQVKRKNKLKIEKEKNDQFLTEQSDSEAIFL